MKVDGNIMERIQMNATEGLKLITEMVTNNWLSEMSGISFRMISFGIKHNIVNGKPYYFNEWQIRQINNAIILMSDSILYQKMFSDQDSFFSLKRFGKKIKLNYIFQTLMGKTSKWQRMHMNDITETRYYGKFTDQEIININLSLRQMSAKLRSIELVCDKPE